MMTYREILPIWWSMTWRSVIAGAFFGGMAGEFAGFAAAWVGRADLAGPWAEVVIWIVSIFAGIWALRAAINIHMLRPVSPDQ